MELGANAVKSVDALSGLVSESVNNKRLSSSRNYVGG